MISTALRALVPQSVLNWREQRYFLTYGEIEMQLVDILCRPDRDAIDVGANYGGYIHFMRRYARHVTAYEPIPDFVNLLRRKFPADVEIEQLALSDMAGIAELYTPVIDDVPVSGCSTLSLAASATYPSHTSMRIRTARLDDVYHGAPGFIKIDVEGHEYAVLAGARNIISGFLPRVLVEIDDHLSPGGIERAVMYFGPMGYQGYYVHRYRLHPIGMFDPIKLQDPPNAVDMTASIKDRSGDGGDYVSNFIFIPSHENTIVRQIRERLGLKRAADDEDDGEQSGEPPTHSRSSG
jgi:FkbM family methyltransferase